jgi:hypothetical protein
MRLAPMERGDQGGSNDVKFVFVAAVLTEITSFKRLGENCKKKAVKNGGSANHKGVAVDGCQLG